MAGPWSRPDDTCFVSPYDATFEVVKGQSGEYSDVKVQLEINYHVLFNPKSEGFKFVGELPIEDISVEDDKGNPIKWQKTVMRETRIAWFFDPVVNTQKNVVVRFRIVGAVGGDKKRGKFYAPWFGVFRLKVTDGLFRFVFPADFKPAE
ncbi:MAG: hypothetical protein RDV41_10050, partial [Planctomycetota bacterium]|nr:hypothetical protein [Planctomycetota bacterium]